MAECLTSPVIVRKQQFDRADSSDSFTGLGQVYKDLLEFLKSSKRKPSKTALKIYIAESEKWKDLDREHRDYSLKMKLQGLLQYLTTSTADFLKALSEEKVEVYSASTFVNPTLSQIPFDMLTNHNFVSPEVPVPDEQSPDLFSENNENVLYTPQDSLVKVKHFSTSNKPQSLEHSKVLLSLDPTSYDPSGDLFSENIQCPLQDDHDVLNLKNLSENVARNYSRNCQKESNTLSIEFFGQIKPLKNMSQLSEEESVVNIEQIDGAALLDTCTFEKKTADHHQIPIVTLSMDCDMAIPKEFIIKKSSTDEEKLSLSQFAPAVDANIDESTKSDKNIFNLIDNKEQCIKDVKLAIKDFYASFSNVVNEIINKMKFDDNVSSSSFDLENERIIKEAFQKAKRLKLK